MPYDLPDLEVSDAFRTLEPLMEARGWRPGGEVSRVPPGAELDALREAVPDLRGTITATGMPDAVTTCDLISGPYPTRFALWRATTSPSPFVTFTNRMLVVQWTDGDGTPRTLLWEPSDAERIEYTPFYARLAAGDPMRTPGIGTGAKLLTQATLRTLGRDAFSTTHGTVLGHLQALGIDPGDVDYLAFDHLHVQDVRRLIGTRSPAPDLGSADEPVEPWFPNAQLLVQAREWDALRHLHPLQAPWYQPETYTDLRTEAITLVDGDVLLGPGVALLATPGHTSGNMSLVVRTHRGVWTSSENGVAAESWAPHASQLPGVRDWATEWGQQVVLNANTIEFAAWQYDHMVVESLVADPTPEGVFPQCFPTSELTANRFNPGTSPTYTHGGIEHGTVRQSRVVEPAVTP